VQNLIEDLEKIIHLQIKEKVIQLSKGKGDVISDTDDEINLNNDCEN
jgi:hypothetical protein